MQLWVVGKEMGEKGVLMTRKLSRVYKKQRFGSGGGRERLIQN